MTFAFLLTPNHETKNVDLQTVEFHGSDIVESIGAALEARETDVTYGRGRLDQHVIYSNSDAKVSNAPGFIFMEDISDTAIPGRLIIMGVVHHGDAAVITSPSVTVGTMQELCEQAYGDLKTARAVVRYLDNLAERYR